MVNFKTTSGRDVQTLFDDGTGHKQTAIQQFTSEFSVAQLELRCPGVSRDMVRRVLRERQAAGEVECQGRGPAAKWRKKRVITL